MSIQRLVAVIALTAMTTGCHSFGIFAKRESEANCPTDIRKTVPWCAGEDAIFVCPCGPNGNFYGHRPTCWRDWPTSAEAWRDMSCGPTVVVEASEPNPFRGPQPTPALSPEPAPAPTELPTPAPMPSPSPFGLPPLPGAAAPAKEDADAEKLGPPVLPPSTSTKRHDTAPVVLHRESSAAPVTLPTPIADDIVAELEDHSVAPVATVPATGTPVAPAASNFVAPVAQRAAVASDPSGPAPADQSTHSVNQATQPVTSSEYLETENRLQVITAAEPQASSVEQSGHESEIPRPAAGHAPKFVRPGMGYGFIR